jgi:hypothetical protein
MHNFSDLFLNHMIGQIQSATFIIGTLCAVGVLAYCGDKIWQSIANNEPISLYPLVRPFLMAFLCLNFWMVINVTNGLLNPVVNGVKNRFSSSAQKTVEKQIAEEVVARHFERNWEERLGDWGQRNISDPIMRGLGWVVGKQKTVNKRIAERKTEEVVRSVSQINENSPNYDIIMVEAERRKQEIKDENAFRDEAGLFLSALKDFFVWLSGVCYRLVHFGIQCLRVVYLSLLIMMGPIAMALSIFPGFTGNFKNWLIKYVSVYLWLPVLYFVEFTLAQLDSFVNKNSAMMDFGAAGMAVTIQIVGVFCMLSIPTIASWMVQGGETGQGLRTPFAMMGAAAGAAGGAVAGKAGVVVGLAANTGNAISSNMPNPGSSS